MAQTLGRYLFAGNRALAAAGATAIAVANRFLAPTLAWLGSVLLGAYAAVYCPRLGAARYRRACAVVGCRPP